MRSELEINAKIDYANAMVRAEESRNIKPNENFAYAAGIKHALMWVIGQVDFAEESIAQQAPAASKDAPSAQDPSTFASAHLAQEPPSSSSLTSGVEAREPERSSASEPLNPPESSDGVDDAPTTPGS